MKKCLHAQVDNNNMTANEKKGINQPLLFDDVPIENYIFLLLYAEIRKWANRNLDEKGKPEVSTEELLGVVGIEIGMSYIRMNNMSDYWKNIYGE